MDTHEPEEHLAQRDGMRADGVEEQPRLERLKAQLDALNTKYEQSAADPLAAAPEHQARMAEMARINASLQQTQAALDSAKLKTSVAQVRRWAEEETHPNWFWAAYADLAQRLTWVEDLWSAILLRCSCLELTDTSSPVTMCLGDHER
jgi:hypothetical protein